MKPIYIPAILLMLMQVCIGDAKGTGAYGSSSGANVAVAPNSPDTWPAKMNAAREERLEWWRDAKLGLFIHWGPASVAGIEINVPVEQRDEIDSIIVLETELTE